MQFTPLGRAVIQVDRQMVTYQQFQQDMLKNRFKVGAEVVQADPGLKAPPGFKTLNPNPKPSTLSNFDCRIDTTVLST